MSLALALVGCGLMGRRHLLGMQRLRAVGRLDFHLAAVCDVAPASAQHAADQAHDLLGRRPDVFTSLDALLRGARPDALLLTTTPDTHPALALAAFAAGLHVLVEKPLALTVAQGAQLVAAAQAAGRTLAVAENYRRDPPNRLAHALLQGGALGRPFLVTQHSSSSGQSVILAPWRHQRSRGGIVLDMGVHYTDLLEYFLGPIAAVAGLSAVVDEHRLDAAGAAHPADAEDLSLGVLRFASGALGSWTLNLAGRGTPTFTRAFQGTGGSLALPGDRSGQPLSLHPHGAPAPLPPAEVLSLVPNFALDPTTAALFGGERLAAYDLPFAEVDANLLAIEQADFAHAITHGRAPEVDGQQGLRSVALIEALLQSQALGRFIALDDVLAPAPLSPEAHP